MADEKEPMDLATIGDQIQGVIERPKSVDARDRSGKEDIRRDEVQLPRLAIAQGLSPQLVPGEGKYIEGLVIGTMFNDVSEEKYGNGPLTLVPVLRHVTRIEFDPNDRKVPIDREVPADDPRMKWTKDPETGEGIPPRATEFVEFACLLLRPGKEPEQVVVSIKTTNKQQRAAAKLWTTYIDSRPGAIYTGLYKISSKIEKGKNRKGEDTMYGVYVVKNAGFIPDTPAGVALREYAKAFHEASKGKKIATERDGADDFDTDAMEREAAAAAATDGVVIPPM